MVKFGTKLKVADNTGARIVKIIGMPGSSKRRWVGIGDVVTVSVQTAIPRGTLKEHEMCEGIIVRTKKEHRRKDGTYVKFDDNAVVIVEKGKKNPRGTRIFGPIAREVKEKGYDRIASLAPEVL